MGSGALISRELADRYGVAADLALHAPRTVTDKELAANPAMYHETDAIGRRHNGNWHAHIMLSACHVSPKGELGKKAVELDPIHCQRAKIENMTERERGRWAALVNGALERAGHDQRIDHRSHKERGIEAVPSQHLGPAAAGLERRTGQPSRKRQGWEQDAALRLAKAKAAGELERQARQVERGIIDLSGDLNAARGERDRQQQDSQDKAQEAAREFGRQAAAKFKAEQAAREFGRQATEQFKADIAAKEQAEQERQRATEREQDRAEAKQKAPKKDQGQER